MDIGTFAGVDMGKHVETYTCMYRFNLFFAWCVVEGGCNSGNITLQKALGRLSHG